MNQHYFDVPFAFAGDVTAIPDPLQTGGTVSFTEGWNYNYQRDLATDPAALPIDRSTTNWLLLQITTALQALQMETVPEFILASQNGGVAIAYGPQAEVLWSASGNAPFAKYVNISGAANSNTPSASDPLGATTGWQIACDPIATAAQAGAGTNNASIMTPLLVAQQTALRALLAGSATQVFNVGVATSLTHAPEAGQVQLGTLNYAGAAGGTANALTATLAPAPTAYAAPLEVIVQVSTTNTGATTLNVNGLGAKGVVGAAHAALQGNELVAGGLACFVYDASLSEFILAWSTGGSEQVGNATQSQHASTLEQVVIAAGANCRLSYSGSNVVLNQYKGSFAYIPGLGIVTIPSGGVTLAPSGLTAATKYNIYLTVTSGTPTLIASTTAHATDPTGVEVMSGDNTKLFVGMEYATSATVWAGLCRSWYNDPGYVAIAPLTASVTLNGNVTNTEVSTSLRAPFLAFANEVVFASSDGTANSNVQADTAYSKLAFDGTVPEENGCGTAAYAGSGSVASFTGYAVSVVRNTLTEGYHYVTLLGDVAGSFSGTWVGSAAKGNRVAVRVAIQGHR